MRSLERLWALCLICFLATGASDARPRRMAHPRVRTMMATAFVSDGDPTASGTTAREGIVAADPAVLPMGTRIRVTGSKGYDGVYLVTDTGNKVDGAHIDLCLRSQAEAKQFGKRTVRVQVLSVGKGKENAREKEGQAALRPPERPR